MFKQKVKIKLFDKHIATMYTKNNHVYLVQINQGAHLASPISISKNTTIIETSKYKSLEGVAGFIYDTLLCDYSQNIIDNIFLKKLNKKATICDQLLFIGDCTLGALTFEPIRKSHINNILSYKSIFQQQDLNKKLDLSINNLINISPFFVGAHSKAIVGINIKTKKIYPNFCNNKLPINFIPVIIKYNIKKNECIKLEYIYSKLAIECGIHMPKTFLIEQDDECFFIIERFDTINDEKVHIHSLGGLLHGVYKNPSSLDYLHLFQVAKQLNIPSKGYYQIYLRMMFNFLFMNYDDHSKNFSFILLENEKWDISPAYDLTYSKCQKNTQEHKMLINTKKISKANLDDFIQVAKENNIHIVFIYESIKTMIKVREKSLPKLLKKYKISQNLQTNIFKNFAKFTI